MAWSLIFEQFKANIIFGFKFYERVAQLMAQNELCIENEIDRKELPFIISVIH